MPRRMNRNVRAFITLYGSDLPFVDPRDLPGGAIEAITLVDTQALVTLKGMNAKTRVHVVDHHPARGEFPAGWSVTTEEVGATTTLFVEALQEPNGALGMLQATLLLLGIYEDTGSLTYSRTTPRDLQAAAFLLERGADLKIAASFLNHPLSMQQQTVYDRLRAAVETHVIHGHTVVLACGEALETDEELSTIAHKLRDLLDADAVFVLVATHSGVQLIARSTSDHIDVAAIAARFGGGGHERAAAGLTRGRSLAELREALLQVLAELVRPAVTVAQIMSRGPQVLELSTSAEEAARQMQRYGYEGYPVVDDERVVGLLTRRAVDRALAHKLNLKAASLMEAGEIKVAPDDSLEHVQRLMADSGWGQIPVVDSTTGRVIGIVTRTDLLKTLMARTRPGSRQNLAARLESALPATHLALLQAAAQIAHDQHSALYIVGGFVRDLLLDRPSLDFDLVVEGDAIALAKALSQRYGGRLTSHTQFGTAKWYLPNGLAQSLAAGAAQSQPLPGFLDLITARREFYTYPTALPTVERGSIKLDLHRRDFTINTLALRLDGRHYGDLHDYWGGLNDLRQMVVRVLHSLSFVDDPTRMLRAVRFEQRFGFQIERRTLHLLNEALNLMARVSGDRIRHELDHILDEPHAGLMLARLSELKLLEAIHADLMWDDWLRSRLERLPQAPDELSAALWPGLAASSPKWLGVQRTLAYAMWLMRLVPDHVPAVTERLKIARGVADDIQAASWLWREVPALAGLRPSQVVQHLEPAPLLALYAVCLATDQPGDCETLRAYITRWRTIMPVTTGDDLRTRGLPPGPVYQRILGRLRQAWLDNEITTAAQEQALLEQLLAHE
jgi:tRNA nucleotidyltransferase (CCA-adding enzyme)